MLWIQAHKHNRQLEAEIFADPISSRQAEIFEDPMYLVKPGDIAFKYHVLEKLPSCKLIRLWHGVC